MPKLKTNKAILERLKITGSGKLIRRRTNQDHFNAKDSGKQGRLKHRSSSVKSQDKKAFVKFLPYNR